MQAVWKQFTQVIQVLQFLIHKVMFYVVGNWCFNIVFFSWMSRWKLKYNSFHSVRVFLLEFRSTECRTAVSICRDNSDHGVFQNMFNVFKDVTLFDYIY